MGQKVNPHGLRVGVIKTGIRDGTQKMKNSAISSYPTTKSESI